MSLLKTIYMNLSSSWVLYLQKYQCLGNFELIYNSRILDTEDVNVTSKSTKCCYFYGFFFSSFFFIILIFYNFSQRKTAKACFFGFFWKTTFPTLGIFQKNLSQSLIGDHEYITTAVIKNWNLDFRDKIFFSHPKKC